MHSPSPRDWLERRSSDNHAGTYIGDVDTGSELGLNFPWTVHRHRNSRIRALGIAHPAKKLPAWIWQCCQDNNRAFWIERLRVALDGATAGRGRDQRNGLEIGDDRLIAVHEQTQG